MLPSSVIQEVWELLQAGELSQRKIALKTGVSRGTVSAIANGQRNLAGSSAEQEQPIFERCPGCGALVTMPCVLCQARAYYARRQRMRPARGARVGERKVA